MKLSLVVPCFNEEDSVEAFYNAVTMQFKGVPYDYEIVFVNDGSRDKTFPILKKIYDLSHGEVKVVSFSRNFGKESAIYAGLKESSGDYVTVIDADLQQNPKYVLQMVEMLEANDDLDCVAAYQKDRKESKSLVFFKDMFYKVINKMTEVKFVSGASDFRTFRRNMLDSILEMSEYYRFSKGIFSWVGYNVEYIPYEVEERAAGTSKWSFVKLLKYAIEGIVSFTTTPLRFATAGGALTLAASFIFLIVAFIRFCTGIETFGIAPLIFLVLFLGGAIWLSIGIVGEYLARTYMQTKGRPIYIAKTILKPEDKKDN